MVPERCERFRESISLGVDDMLSRFERALLERHLRSCPSCCAFSADVAAQTALLRSAPLETMAGTIEIPASRRRVVRRRAAGFAGAVAVATMAALVSFTPAGDRQTSSARDTAPNSALLAVELVPPTANSTFEIGRLHLVPPSSADGAVRGYYGVPA